ncbi:Rid family hydrolase [Hoeflea sp. BAL378]|uniref:Rid family hydrolase n=1 Tax=Hoeflea sp. BAL378 TaxID=1547437 RepID=UPI00068DBC74|nr:Rid family hydrolase [Hoeflea sp. BAL378]
MKPGTVRAGKPPGQAQTVEAPGRRRRIKDKPKKCLKNFGAIASEAGIDLSRTVKTTVLLTDLGEFGAANEVYGQHFAAPFPARACYQVAALPKGAMVEVEAILAL